MAKVDLHIHSKYSDDGEFSAAQILDMCKEKNMRMVSVTDHNSVKGMAEAVNTGKQADIDVIAGIEMDCTYKGRNFHLLGYCFDYTRKEFYEIEEDIRNQEMKAASEKIGKFRKASGVDITEKEVFDAAEGAIITGEMIGEIVLNKEDAGRYEILKPYLKGGAKSDMPYVNFYWDFFSKGKAAYVPIHYISLNDAKDIIHSSGGISVLAHPAQNLKDEFSFIDEIIKEGINGIEAFSSYHTPEGSVYFYNKVLENNLIVTCGSDFHGKNKPQISIGDCKLTINEEIIMNGITGKKL